MTDRESYSAEIIDGTMVVQFIQSSLVFTEQVRTIETDLKSPHVEAQFRAVVFDFTDVDYISSSVWGELIRLNSLLREGATPFRLCNLTDKLREVLDAMKLDQILAVFGTRADALQGLND